MEFKNNKQKLKYATEVIKNSFLVDELLELWTYYGIRYTYAESDCTGDWINLYDNTLNHLYSQKYSDTYEETTPEKDDIETRSVIYLTRSDRLHPVDLFRYGDSVPIWKPNDPYGYLSIRRCIKFLIKITIETYRPRVK